MNGGVSSKIGHGYEEEYVVWQALRLLDETIEELVWEARGEDERGIDLWIREGGRGRVAIQCKTRSRDLWTVRKLEKERVFEHARLQLLERAEGEGAARYEFVTNQRAPDWELAIKDAETGGDLAPHAEAVAAIGEDATGLLPRMKVRVRDQESIEDDARTIARTLVPHSEASRLIDALRETLRTRLQEPWSKVSLQKALEPFGLEWIRDGTGRRLADHLIRITNEFIEDVARSRLLPRHLDRPEEEQLAAEALTAPRGSLVLVRGAPGSGKSEVLASLVEPARSAGATVLALSADELSDLDRPDDLSGRMRSLGGDANSLLVLDQVDQLARGGARHQPALRRVVRLVDAARRAGHVVVVGCRTIEASRVAQLENLLGAPGPGRRIDVEVGDLPEAGVAEVLQERGIPLDDLNPEIRHLVRRPIVLSLLVRVIDGTGGWRGVRSQ
ncbi:MAG: hypothetical protein ACF8XB_07025, partial [Planctomycetota bacterium JB042]